MAQKLGIDGDNMFYYKEKSGKMVLKTDEKRRGRTYDTATKYPKDDN